MNRWLWILILILEGCASTSYEKCDRQNEWVHYGSMDACVAIKEQDRQQRKEYWKNFSFVDSNANQPRPIQNCTSFVSGNTINTNCN